MTQFPEFKKASLYCHVHGKTNCQDCADQNLAEGIRLDQERIRDLEQRLAAANGRLEEYEEKTCNCRWEGETLVRQCELHEAHVDAIHEWAERAKVAEQRLAAAEEKIPKWIPVSEQLPELYKEVLGLDENMDQSACYLSDNGNFYGLVFGQHAYDCGASILTGQVTHWMPRPEPPNNGENAGSRGVDMKTENFISYCYVKPRPDECPLFSVDSCGNITSVRLAGYAIIPLEDYAKFFDGEEKKEMLALAEQGKQFLEGLKGG